MILSRGGALKDCLAMHDVVAVDVYVSRRHGPQRSLVVREQMEALRKADHVGNCQVSA